MKSNNHFLYYYSLIAATILLLVSLFTLPKPQNIVNTILLAPVVFLLWTYALNPDFFDAPKWSPKFGAIAIVFCFLGIFSYFLFSKYTPSTPNSESGLNDVIKSLTQSNMEEKEYRDKLEATIIELKTKIDNLGRSDQIVLGTTTPTESPVAQKSPIGQITIKDENLTTVSIYEKESQESKITGSALYVLDLANSHLTNE